jgi:nitroimidazol reductase NimA-like FMN-containing flavoprotein (pyridoxamine 5'-phosphate oxidase superfamily)
VGDTAAIEGRFTIAYESAVVFGTVEEVLVPEEKIRCLRLICLRHTPNNMQAFDDAIQKLLTVTAVWKLHIDEISGKCNYQVS